MRKRATSEPPPGSVIASAAILSPRSTGGTTRCCSSREPKATIGDRVSRVGLLPGHRLAIDGVEQQLHHAPLDADQWHLQIDGIDALITDASYEPSSNGDAASAARELRAPFNGRIVALHAAANQDVAAGSTLLVIESMKLEHAITAPRSGKVASVSIERGQQVATRQLLITFETTA